MKIFSANQIRDIDRFTIENEPIASIDLMERAANALLIWFVTYIDCKSRIVIFAGTGNNGGDGLALGRMLVETGFDVEVYYLESNSYSNDFIINLNRIQKQGVIRPMILSNEQDLLHLNLNPETIIVDALFGSGLSRPLNGLASKLVDFINGSRCKVVAIDVPSGLFCEANQYPNTNSVVRASFTLTLQFPKLSFFHAENNEFVGEWKVLPIGLHNGIIKSTHTPYIYIEESEIIPLFKYRRKFGHKGDCGHCLIIAGSKGMMGASVLASTACIKSGAGLVTAHIPKIGHAILQQSIPEVMVDLDENECCFSSVDFFDKYSAIGVGPGLGKSKSTVDGLKNLLSTILKPLVIDADGLNIIAENSDLLKLVPIDSIITPHPGEFDRLFGKSTTGYQRLQLAIEKSKEFKVVIVLKGAYTQVICPEGNVYFNSTGNPGMATGGSGDVLTGIITSLLGQKYTPISAAVLGVYLHGLAGDLALQKNGSNSLTANDIISYLGDAFKTIEN